MACPPQVSNGYLGAQPKFSEMKMCTDSHREARFKVNGDNCVVIKFKCDEGMKVTTRLYRCPSDVSPELLEGFVFAQRKDKGELRFHVGFPDNGFFKFEVFALKECEQGDSLPNVYNHLIEVENNIQPAVPYVKPYTKFFTDCCYLDKPLFFKPTSNLDDTKFELVVPGAVKVAVHCGEEWFHLEKKGSEWKGKANLEKYKGKDSKVTVNASYEKDSNSYSVLLEYKI